MRNKIRELYVGESDRAHRFRYALLAFDLGTILFVIATSFTHHGPFVEAVDAVFGVIILAEFSARFWISTNRAADDPTGDTRRSDRHRVLPGAIGG